MEEVGSVMIVRIGDVVHRHKPAVPTADAAQIVPVATVDSDAVATDPNLWNAAAGRRLADLAVAEAALVGETAAVAGIAAWVVEWVGRDVARLEMVVWNRRFWTRCRRPLRSR